MESFLQTVISHKLLTLLENSAHPKGLSFLPLPAAELQVEKR